ncbi:auxin efflux carrier [Meredithblackwellia eburnea MCA 4105]
MFISRSTPLSQALATPNPVGALIHVVVDAIAEVFFLCLVGWILAKKGIVDDKAKKTLNKINVSLFTPALLFSKVAFSLTPDKLRDLGIIPIGFVVLTCFSAAVAWVLGTLFRLKRGHKNFAVACAMFQNSNSLPIALMQSLIGEKMPLQWGPDDDKDQMLGRALSYLVLFSTLGIIVRWSIGVRLLSSAESVGEDGETGNEPLPVEDVEDQEAALYGNSRNGGSRRRTGTGVGGDQTPLLHESARSRTHSSGSEVNGLGVVMTTDQFGNGKPTIGGGGENGNGTVKVVKVGGGGRSKRPRSIFQSFPNTPIPSTRNSVHGGSSEGDVSDVDDDEDDEDAEWGVRRGVGRRDEDDEIFDGVWVVRWRKFRRRAMIVGRPVGRVAKRIGEFMTVPLWAAILSLIVACIPPLQHYLNEAEPLKAAIKNAGNCSVPITLITLGAYFYDPTPPSSRGAMTTSSPTESSFFTRMNPFINSRRPSSGRPSRPGESRTVFVAVVSRMIIVPLVMLPLFGWYAAKTTNVADDPVFVVVSCLLIGSPAAITLAQITSSAAGETFEKLISRTLFVSYAILTAPCTILLVLAALLIDRNQ